MSRPRSASVYVEQELHQLFRRLNIQIAPIVSQCVDEKLRQHVVEQKKEILHELHSLVQMVERMR